MRGRGGGCTSLHKRRTATTRTYTSPETKKRLGDGFVDYFEKQRAFGSARNFQNGSIIQDRAAVGTERTHGIDRNQMWQEEQEGKAVHDQCTVS